MIEMNKTDISNSVLDHKELSLKELILIFRDQIRYIRLKWKTVFVFILIGACLGFFYASRKKPVFTATTTFVLEDDKSSGMIGQYSSIAAMAGIDLGGSTGGIFHGENIIQLYTSHSMIEKALLAHVNYQGKNQLLIDRFIDIENLREKWTENPELSGITFNKKPGRSFSRLQDSILSKAVEKLNEEYLSVAKPDKKLSVIKVTVSANNEEFAKDFNQEIVRTVNTFFVQTRTKKAMENIEILQHQTDSVKSVMNGAIFQSAQSNDATPNLNPTRQILRVPIQRSQYNAEANKAILTQLIPNLELAKISLRKETPLIQIIDEPIYPLTKTKLSRVISAVVGALLLGVATTIILIITRLKLFVLNN